MKAIVCVSENYAIGRNGDLLFHIKDDMKRFKNETVGCAVVMGKKTYDSLPEKFRPLPQRFNIVMSRSMKQEDFHDNGALVAHSKDEVIQILHEKWGQTKYVFIIGGESIYRMFLDECDEVLLTKVHQEVLDADAFFPNLDQMKNWKRLDEDTEERLDETSGLKYSFETYQNLDMIDRKN